MNIVSHKKLKDFYSLYKDAATPVEQWYYTVKRARWTCFADVKRDFNNVDYIGNQHYVFNIKGNDYRLVVVIQFTHGYVYIRFIGTHSEYDKIDCKTI